MEELQSWWEVPSIAHFCSLFKDSFGLPEFDIEDLEFGLIHATGEENANEKIIIELLLKLIKGCVLRNIREDQVFFNLRKLFLRYKDEPGVDRLLKTYFPKDDEQDKLNRTMKKRKKKSFFYHVLKDEPATPVPIQTALKKINGPRKPGRKRKLETDDFFIQIKDEPVADVVVDVLDDLLKNVELIELKNEFGPLKTNASKSESGSVRSGALSQKGPRKVGKGVFVEDCDSQMSNASENGEGSMLNGSNLADSDDDEEDEGDKTDANDLNFNALPVRAKVDILKTLCDLRLDAYDAQDNLKDAEGDALRLTPVGKDQEGTRYWYFYGTRLYTEKKTMKKKRTLSPSREAADCSESPRNSTRKSAIAKKLPVANHTAKKQSAVESPPLRLTRSRRGDVAVKAPVMNEPESQVKKSTRKRRGDDLDSATNDERPLSTDNPDKGLFNDSESVAGVRKSRRTLTPSHKAKEIKESKAFKLTKAKPADLRKFLKKIEDDSVSVNSVTSSTRSTRSGCVDVGEKRNRAEADAGLNNTRSRRKPLEVTEENNNLSGARRSRRSSAKKTVADEDSAGDSTDEQEPVSAKAKRASKEVNGDFKNLDADKALALELLAGETRRSGRLRDKPKVCLNENTILENSIQKTKVKPVSRARAKSVDDDDYLPDGLSDDASDDGEVIDEESDDDDDWSVGDGEEEDTTDAVSRWTVACTTMEDWEQIAEKFAASTVPCEKKLHKTILLDFLPEMPKLFAEREKVIRKRLVEFLPRRQSDRIVTIRSKREQEQIDEQRLMSSSREERRARRDESDLFEPSNPALTTAEDRIRRAKLREERLIMRQLDQNSSLRIGDATYSTTELESRLENVITVMKRSRHSWPFLDEVDPTVAPDYTAVVKNPMTVNRLSSKLKNHDYTTRDDFISDTNLIFDNCYLYNGAGSRFYKIAELLRSVYERAMEANFPEEHSDDDADDDSGGEIVEVANQKPRGRPKKRNKDEDYDDTQEKDLDLECVEVSNKIKKSYEKSAERLKEVKKSSRLYTPESIQLKGAPSNTYGRTIIDSVKTGLSRYLGPSMSIPRILKQPPGDLLKQLNITTTPVQETPKTAKQADPKSHLVFFRKYLEKKAEGLANNLKQSPKYVGTVVIDEDGTATTINNSDESTEDIKTELLSPNGEKFEGYKSKLKTEETSPLTSPAVSSHKVSRTYNHSVSRNRTVALNLNQSSTKSVGISTDDICNIASVQTDSAADSSRKVKNEAAWTNLANSLRETANSPGAKVVAKLRPALKVTPQARPPAINILSLQGKLNDAAKRLGTPPRAATSFPPRVQVIPTQIPRSQAVIIQQPGCWQPVVSAQPVIQQPTDLLQQAMIETDLQDSTPPVYITSAPMPTTVQVGASYVVYNPVQNQTMAGAQLVGQQQGMRTVLLLPSGVNLQSLGNITMVQPQNMVESVPQTSVSYVINNGSA